ncbi:MAG: PepSY domain-containing protein, partial [Myxococcota bacterium]
MAHKISSLIAGSLALQLACGTESWEYTEGPMAPGWDDPFAANVLAGESREDNAEQSAGSDRSRRAIERSLSHLRRNVDPRFANDDYSVEVDVVTLHEDGAESVRFRTRFLGYRVLGGDVVVHSDERGALRNIERSLQQGIFLDTSELLSESDALQLALEKLRGTLEETPEPELIIYALGHEVGPAYEVRLRAVLEDATPSLLHVYIDAVTGEHLTSWDAIIVEPITSPEQVVTAEALLDAASADDLLVLGTSSIPLDQTF